MRDYFNYYLPDTSEAEMKKCLLYICDMYHLKTPSIDQPAIDYVSFYKADYDAYIKRNINPAAVSLDDNWNQWFFLLQSYKADFGHPTVPKNCTYKGQNLGRWCQTTKGRYNGGKLSQDKIDKLNSVGFVWDLLEYEWNRRYDQYLRYIDETGSPVITRRTDYEGEHLGVWIQTQKLRQKEGKLSRDRVCKLLEVNKQIFDESE